MYVLNICFLSMCISHLWYICIIREIGWLRVTSLRDTVPIETLGQTCFFLRQHRFLVKNNFSSIVLRSRLTHPVSRPDLVDMPRALSQNKSQLVKTLLDLDLPHDAIATSAKCSERSVRRISYNLEHYASTTHPKAAKQGRPSNLTDEMEQVLCYSLQFKHTNFRAFSNF